MDDFDLSLVSEANTKTRYELRAEFYRLCRFREHFWDGTSKLSARRPDAFVRFEEVASQHLRVQYGHDFYVIIEKGGSLLSGPHKGMLYMQHKDYPDGVWLGTLQFDGSYFDDRGLKKQLRKAIIKREYWMSTESEDEEIELGEREEILDLREIKHHPPPQKPRNEVRILCTQIHPTRTNVWGGLWWIPPACPLCGAERKTVSKMEKHFRLNHKKKKLVVTYSSLLTPSWDAWG